MYKVIINHNDKEIVIGDITSTSSSRRILNGKINKEINSIANFEFDISSDNVGYEYLVPLKTQIRVYNTITNKNVFEGRILQETDLLEDNGKIYKSFNAEDKLGYLIDSIQTYTECDSIKAAIEYLLDIHNSCVDDWKKIYPGEIDFVVQLLEGEKVILTYDDSLENIKRFINSYGGEVTIRSEGNKNYLDYKDIIGEYTETPIKLGLNLKQFQGDKDPTQCCSRVVALGKKLDNSEERITIASINNNKIYVEDKELVEKIGYVTKKIEYDEEEDKNVLKTKALEYLNSQKINLSNTLTALDLSLLGTNYDAFTLGSFYKLDVQIFSIFYYVRIIKESIDINNPQVSTLVFGDKLVDIKNYQLESTKNNKSIRQEIEATKKNINQLAINTNKAIQKVNTIEGSLTGYVNVNEYNTYTLNLEQRLIELENRISLLEGGGANG